MDFYGIRETRLAPWVVLLIIATLAPAIAWAIDSDGDGIDDSVDNCTTIGNPSQFDVDLDGYGNLCDSDYNNDGVVGNPDFVLFAGAYGSAQHLPEFVDAADHNGDGIIGGPDFVVFRALFGGLPGPSGLACAGIVPCGLESAGEFVLDTAASQSFAAVGATQGLFVSGSTAAFYVVDNGAGTGIIDFDFSLVGLPAVQIPFQDAVFEFTILPDDEFSLSIDLENGHINQNLEDPDLMVRVDRFIGAGVLVSSMTVELPLTTGIATLQDCQGGQSVVGSPIDSVSGHVMLLGVACLEGLGTTVTIQLQGVLPIAVGGP